ncbi:MAG: hypothetical protein EGQ84_03720, partial [Slackia sp.]|nr:hypothetical protein [Slackia sp.]
EKNISGIFLETDTGENIDILLVGKDGRVEELRGRTPAEELVRFASLDFAEYHAVIQRLWTEHPLFLERMDVPYSDYEDFEKQIGDFSCAPEPITPITELDQAKVQEILNA